MTGVALVLWRLEVVVLSELRAAWASGRRVSVTIDGELDRLEGHVSRVAPTGVFVVVAGRHLPTELVLAVHHPSRLGDSTWRGGEWHGRERRWHPQDESLW